MTIENDQQFKKALAELSLEKQRELAAQFINSVISLNSDPVIVRVLEAVQKTNSDFRDIYKVLKALSINTYTSCGSEADWTAQVAHFVASAAKLCATPEDLLHNKNNLAWQCAMQTRMANNCAMMDSDSDEVDNEAQKQYGIAGNFI